MRYTDESTLPEVKDDILRASLGATRPYTVVILKAGPRFSPAGPDREPEVAATIWRHGKRNFALRMAGLLRVVCPVADGGEVVGVGIFDAAPDEVDRIMAADPAVMAEILRYEIHPTRTFPDSTLAD
jgi:hypothetical protein